jgi:hypothetical protein
VRGHAAPAQLYSPTQPNASDPLFQAELVCSSCTANSRIRGPVTRERGPDAGMKPAGPGSRAASAGTLASWLPQPPSTRNAADPDIHPAGAAA